MSGPVGGDKDVYDEINITPMLDLLGRLEVTQLGLVTQKIVK